MNTWVWVSRPTVGNGESVPVGVVEVTTNSCRSDAPRASGTSAARGEPGFSGTSSTRRNACCASAPRAASTPRSSSSRAPGIGFGAALSPRVSRRFCSLVPQITQFFTGALGGAPQAIRTWLDPAASGIEPSGTPGRMTTCGTTGTGEPAVAITQRFGSDATQPVGDGPTAVARRAQITTPQRPVPVKSSGVRSTSVRKRRGSP